MQDERWTMNDLEAELVRYDLNIKSLSETDLMKIMDISDLQSAVYEVDRILNG